MTVKVLLQEVRKSKGLSQNELARLTSMSPQNIQKIEQGEAKSLTFKTLSKFCRVLKCQPGDLLMYEDELEANTQKSLINSSERSGQDTKSQKLVEKKDYLQIGASGLFPKVITQTI